MLNKKFHAIILARGNSKEIKNKNIISLINKPLIAWTINHCKKSRHINKIWVSSDSLKIIKISKKYGANCILRPKSISGDNSTSEEGWLHVINQLKKNYKIKNAIVLQATSPIRSSKDLDRAIEKFLKMKYDSLFSSVEVENYFNWIKNKRILKPLFNKNKRLMRQKIKSQLQENGSFYIFNVNKFLKYKNRLFGKVGTYKMKKYQSFQIDNKEDLLIVKSILKNINKFSN